MTQKTSPFVEGKYGWNLGENGWNSGMDENLLKFSYLFDRNIDGVVSTLPTAVDGRAYYSTSDLRVYFVVGGVYYSTPLPKWFELTLKDTGLVYQFNGSILVQIQSASQLDTRLSSVETIKAPINNPTFTGTVSGITKSMVGLAAVDNTSDANKPISTAQQTALALKANISNTLTTDTSQTISGVKGFTKLQDSGGYSLQVLKDSSPLDYSTTKAAFILQQRDTVAQSAGVLTPGAVFQFRSSGNGSVNSSTELSQTIWQGLFSYMQKTGDGSAHAFTGIVEVGGVGAGGYNEGGLFQGEATNTGSALATISGVEMLIKDSPDAGVTTFSTKMQAVVGRLAKYNPTTRKSYNFYASSEGSLAPNGILGVNGSGLHTWQRGLDFQGATFSTGQSILSPNNTALAWLNSTGTATAVMGLDASNGVYIKASTAGAYIQDSAGLSKIGVSSTGIAAFQNATLTASATAGANGALPTQVAGYLTVLINGSTVKLPYYN